MPGQRSLEKCLCARLDFQHVCDDSCSSGNGDGCPPCLAFPGHVSSRCDTVNLILIPTVMVSVLVSIRASCRQEQYTLLNSLQFIYF